MFEALVTVGIAMATGISVLSANVNRRINTLELRVAEKYIPRQEVSHLLERFEEHMRRIEAKLDNLISKD